MGKKIKKEFKEWINALYIALAIVIGLYFSFWPINIKGSSMEPTLFAGDLVFSSKLLLKLKGVKRSDLVLCKIEESDEYIIKRIIALEGDEIEFLNGNIYLNSELLVENYIKGNNYGEFKKTIEEDEVFLLGDNREYSTDSRYFGSVNLKNIKAKVVFTINK